LLAAINSNDSNTINKVGSMTRKICSKKIVLIEFCSELPVSRQVTVTVVMLMVEGKQCQITDCNRKCNFYHVKTIWENEIQAYCVRMSQNSSTGICENKP
jgi:hypothetical protein